MFHIILHIMFLILKITYNIIIYLIIKITKIFNLKFLIL